jgi:hypothetical protein
MKLKVKPSDLAAVCFYEKLGTTVFEGEGIMLLEASGTRTPAES